VLVLDEATSALDPDTEHQIVTELLESRGDVTVIAVTHRKSVCELCDQVYRLEQGTLQPVRADHAGTAGPDHALS
jgi:ABC-type bacteriocin/lantibiotic exporter with double-glycine peptidase domain